MDRREFFKRAGKKTAGEKKQHSSKRMFAGLAPYNGNWTVNEVTHLLKRTMFGAKKSDVDYFLTPVSYTHLTLPTSDLV